MPQRVRISVANLASYLEDAKTREVVAVGIIDKRKFEEKQVTQFTALGGAAEINENFRAFLEREYGAVFKNQDARFEVGALYLEPIMTMFMDLEAHPCECSVRREFVEETADEPVGGQTVLSAEEAAQCTETFMGYVRQAQSEEGVGASLNASVAVPTHRLFGIFKVTVPSPVFKKIVNSSLIRTFSEQELDSTALGARRGTTFDRQQMSDNLGNWVPGLASA